LQLVETGVDLLEVFERLDLGERFDLVKHIARRSLHFLNLHVHLLQGIR
jgi:hypothetical protein